MFFVLRTVMVSLGVEVFFIGRILMFVYDKRQDSRIYYVSTPFF